MWDGRDYLQVDVPVSGAENVMVPVIRAVVRSDEDRSLILLQRRADTSEPVYHHLEIPGGRWRSGESPVVAITREVLEETGITLVSVSGVSLDVIDSHRSIATVRPLAIIAGVEGAFPAVHIVLTATGRGEPRGEAGESEDVRWWRLEDVRRRMEDRPEEFVPSSFAALRAYVETVGSRSDP
jgi:8-oxo-dGTP pyrophosphatase MutT (NUDIX family)